MRYKVVIVVAVVLVAIATFSTWAWAQNANVKYFACINDSSGTIHMANEGETCSNNEVLIEWNAEGPPGQPGDQGPQGEQGLQGEQGPPEESWNDWEQYSYQERILIHPRTDALVTMTCPDGGSMLSGGWVDAGLNNFPNLITTLVVHNSPIEVVDGSISTWGWQVKFRNIYDWGDFAWPTIFCARDSDSLSTLSSTSSEGTGVFTVEYTDLQSTTE